MRASRLLCVLMMLQARGRVSALAMARAFEVSVRTIHRDIDELSAAGIPIVASRGPQGGFALGSGFQTKLTGLAPDEESALAVMSASAPARALGLESAAKSAMLKLFAALPQGGARTVGFAAKVHFDLGPWYHAEATLPHLPGITHAVLEQRIVSMEYESWRGLRRWRVKPLGLVLKAGTWYLVAETPKGITTFSTPKMRQVEVTDDVFEFPKNFDLATHWRTELDRFEMQLRPRVAQILIAPEATFRLKELGQFAADALSKAVSVKRAKQTMLRMDLPIESNEHAARQLMGLGVAFEVLTPAELRAEVRAMAKRCLGMNAQGSSLKSVTV